MDQTGSPTWPLGLIVGILIADELQQQLDSFDRIQAETGLPLI